ncbi:hypothetical protein [Vibrio aestuarianus]|uniref:hypothetical protein n=1 Tax=Vibrio aestuarianus TaxID=28171 RepID=UPI00237C94BF|nr:hypothetical protein [Vibrio aestuarianus]MDE1335791.1 hypothetical protein [Vibrio aestuarianus]
MNFLSALTPTSFKPGGVSRSDMKKGSKLADSVKNVVQYRKLSSEQQKRLKMVASYGRASEYKKAIQQKVSGKLQEFEVLNPSDSNNNTTAQLNNNKPAQLNNNKPAQLDNDKKIIHTTWWESKASSLIREYKDYNKKELQSSGVPLARLDELKSKIVSLESEIKSAERNFASLQGQTDDKARSQKKRLNEDIINLDLQKFWKEKLLNQELTKNTKTETFYKMVGIIKRMEAHLDDRAIPETNPKRQSLVQAHTDLITKKDEYLEAVRRRR